MKPFYHDHPLRTSPPDWAYSCDELRFWIKHLLKSPGTKWGPQALGLALGCGGPDPRKVVYAKIGERKRGWIYPSEQLRFSRQLPRILSGELEPTKINGKIAVRVSDNPQPLKLPPRWRYDLKRGKLERHPFRTLQYRNSLPSFANVMGTERWEGRGND